jgi:hypothetical protein
MNLVQIALNHKTDTIQTLSPINEYLALTIILYTYLIYKIRLNEFNHYIILIKQLMGVLINDNWDTDNYKGRI